MFDNSERIAEEAKNYARSKIPYGSTRLEDNLRKPLHLVEKIRSEVLKPDLFRIEADFELYKFVRSLNVSYQHGLGNCRELAEVALDYIAMRYPAQPAEIYRIENGDHIFLVVGRSQVSRSDKPDTWGNQAYICDPWANKVYPAKDYRNQLKNYYLSGDRKNCVEDLKPAHKLLPYHFSNNKLQLLSLTKTQYLITNYKNKFNIIQTAYNNYKTNLINIAIYLQKRYAYDDQKLDAIIAKINTLNKTLEDITQSSEFKEKNENSPYKNYKKIRLELKRNLDRIYTAFSKESLFSDKDLTLLQMHRNTNYPMTCLYSIFKIKPETITKLNAALDEKKKQCSQLDNIDLEGNQDDSLTFL